jgi:RNA polymerase sigma-70 factor (ECF subfamily)
MELSDHLFRQEAGRMVATLTRVFGVQNLALAEDVVQDAFCRALEVWKLRGVPENPSAWLMATAKNRALDALRRERTARTFEPELSRFLESEWTLAPAVQELFAADAIKDDLLRMMFSCCHPRLSEEAQVTLILHILCGFSVGEVANAFVSTKAAAEKRITRAKRVLAESKKLFDVARADEVAARLPAVQRALYLLFNEGYHGGSAESAIRADLCREAMRLTAMLLEHPAGAGPASYALAALMCFHAARLPGRVDAAGKLSPFSDQDRSRWDRNLISEGVRLLDISAEGTEITEYHLEAGIARVHASAREAGHTDWAAIVSLYDLLLNLRPSPVIALNRAIAIGQRDGPQPGLQEIRNIADSERLERYPFYHAALGEFELRLGRHEAAGAYFRTALQMARNPAERQFLKTRISACQAASSATT